MSILKAVIKSVLKSPIHSPFDDGDGLVPPAGYFFVINKFGNNVIDENGNRVIARKIP